MASEEFQAFQAAMAARPVAPPPATLEEQRARIDANMSQLPLAESIEAEEHDADGVKVIECRPVGAGHGLPVVIYFHGGGFRLASALAYRAYGSQLAKAIGGRVLLVDYRLAPEHPYPAALDDCVTVYRWLIARGGSPSKIVLAGDSAGGGLTASVALRTLAEGPIPAGLVCCSPWVDMTLSGETYTTNEPTDVMFPRSSAELAKPLYLAGHDETDPFVSPVLGSWKGAPPMLIQVGGIESLLDDSRWLAKVASAAGVDVNLHVYADMPHIWQMSYPAFPEAVTAIEEMAAFVARVTA